MDVSNVTESFKKKNVKHIAVVRKELVENTALKSMKDKLN